MLPHGDAPLRNEPTNPQQSRFGRQQVWQPKHGNNRGSTGISEERHIEVDTMSNPGGSRSLAQVGEPFPPKPAARSNDLTKMPSSDTNTLQTNCTDTTNILAGDTNPDTPHIRKVALTVPEDLLTSLRASCTNKATVSLLGRIQGKHPGQKALTAWARDNLHSSLTLLSIKTNNMFEVTFGSPEGRIHALNQADLVCESASIFFSSWLPHFNPKRPQEVERLDHPVWVQFVDLCQMLRTDSFPQAMGEQLGQVISIDNSAAYKAKLFGPRIRLLVKDLNNLPQMAVLPRLDGEGTIEYSLEYSGLPNQCGRCRSHEHQVRFCPRKEQYKRRDTHIQPKN